MPLSSDTLREITAQVRSGFKERERIIEIFCEEMYAPGELEPTEVEAAVDAAIGAHESEKATWPSVTDCDQLDEVFAALNRRGVVALQNAGYTQSDGYDDCVQAYEALGNKHRVVGYCFYQGQDLERAVEGGGLYLAFGPIDPKDEEKKGPAVGKIVVEELERAGFKANWDGTFKTRICIPIFDWKHR